jgi:hypothetical protein
LPRASRAPLSQSVMPGLEPGIHDFCDFVAAEVVDARVKPGHDGKRQTSELPRPEILDRLADLGFGVHHEGPVFGDRFAQGLAGHEDDARGIVAGA